jgi:hypothetical protein
MWSDGRGGSTRALSGARVGECQRILVSLVFVYDSNSRNRCLTSCLDLHVGLPLSEGLKDAIEQGFWIG